jgi:hypothetical protein
MTKEADYAVDPQGRPMFWGIYSGTVVDINDPLKKSRIKVKVQGPTGTEVTNWALACLPITSNANHPDHNEHTAAQIAALLTTTSVGASGGDPQGGSVSITIPALTVVAKTSGTLKHAHKTAANTTEKWNDSQETDTIAEHTPHRIVAKKGQKVWVMFSGGLPEHPVWIGVQP